MDQSMWIQFYYRPQFFLYTMSRFYIKDGREIPIKKDIKGLKDMLQHFDSLEQLLTIEPSYFSYVNYEIRQVMSLFQDVLKRDANNTQNIRSVINAVQSIQNIYEIPGLPIPVQNIPPYVYDLVNPIRELVKKQMEEREEEQIQKIQIQSVLTSLQHKISQTLKSWELNPKVREKLNQMKTDLDEVDPHKFKKARIFETHFQGKRQEKETHGLSNLKIEYDKIIESFKQEIEEKQNQIKKGQAQIKRLSKDKIQQSRKQYTSPSLFSSDTMNLHPKHKIYIHTELKQLLHKQIKETKLLYRYDPLNTTNFHQYIDNHPNIIMVVELSNKNMIAAFSEAALQPDEEPRGKKGIIFALSAERHFITKAEECPVVYNSYFVTFGNNELKIRILDDKVSSTFGTKYGYYETEGHSSPTVLFGGDQKTVQFTKMEIYEIRFS